MVGAETSSGRAAADYWNSKDVARLRCEHETKAVEP